MVRVYLVLAVLLALASTALSYKSCRAAWDGDAVKYSTKYLISTEKIPDKSSTGTPGSDSCCFSCS